MSKGNIIKKFVEDYLKVNNISFTIDKNDIYEVNFETVLANKLGKIRKFAFNRQLSDDYGVDYISLNNDMVKFMLRDSITKGMTIKASLNVPFDVNEKVKLKDIFIKKVTPMTETAIAFLFKVSSTDSNFENKPENLQYVLVDYSECKIIQNDFADEFHNFKLEKAQFKFDSDTVTKAHTVAYEYMISEIDFKYSENEDANKANYEERIEELKRRHEDVIKACRSEESKVNKRISELEDRIDSARTYDKQKDYEKNLQSVKQKLEQLELNNKSIIINSLNSTTFRIQEEKDRFVFDINLYLLSAVVFQYHSQDLLLLSTKTNEEANAKFNDLTKTFSYLCPICKQSVDEPILSYEGHFCCKECGSFDEQAKAYFCKKDNVERCIITGNYVLKNEENYCEVSKKYYDSSLMITDDLGKRVCLLYIKKTPSGLNINNDDAVFIKDMNAYYSPAEIEKCEYSKEQYPLKNLTFTTGSCKKIKDKYVKTCSFTGLTFSPDDMKDNISKLGSDLSEVDFETLNIPELKQELKRNKVLFNENKYWTFILQKTFLGQKKYLYDKKKKVLRKI